MSTGPSFIEMKPIKNGLYLSRVFSVNHRTTIEGKETRMKEKVSEKAKGYFKQGFN